MPPAIKGFDDCVSQKTDASLSDNAIPILMINLGDEDNVSAGVYARPAAALLTQGDYRIVPDATHFSFLAECNPASADIHETLVEMITAYLQDWAR